MNKIFPLAITATLLIGCSSSADDIYLSCNGFSDTLNVYGSNVEEKREPLVLPVQIKRLSGGLLDLFKEPKYQIMIGYRVFENPQLFVDKTEYVGTNKRTTDSDKKQMESRFNINRNTNHLIYYDFNYSPKTKDRENIQKTIDFEGKCEKVQDKI